jgi:hypothetical protein
VFDSSEPAGGARKSGDTITLANNQSFSIASRHLGDFGAGDFSVTVTVQATSDSPFPDGDYGLLFARPLSLAAVGALYPEFGPAAFLYDNGSIEFRLRGRGRPCGQCTRYTCRTRADTVSNWTTPHTLQFTKVNLLTGYWRRRASFESELYARLTIHVDGDEVCNMEIPTPQTPPDCNRYHDAGFTDNVCVPTNDRQRRFYSGENSHLPLSLRHKTWTSPMFNDTDMIWGRGLDVPSFRNLLFNIGPIVLSRDTAISTWPPSLGHFV